MKFSEEMEFFFRGFSPQQRTNVEADPFYQEAAKRGDVVKAQEIATEVMVGNANTRQESRFRGNYSG